MILQERVEVHFRWTKGQFLILSLSPNLWLQPPAGGSFGRRGVEKLSSYLRFGFLNKKDQKISESHWMSIGKKYNNSSGPR